MRPIQVLMDEELLAAVDSEAKRRGSDRSKVVRTALRAFLAAARRRSLEEQYRRGYERTPGRAEEIDPWEDAQAWPEPCATSRPSCRSASSTA